MNSPSDNDGNGSSHQENIGGETKKSLDQENELRDEEVQPPKGRKRWYARKAIASKLIDANGTIAFMSIVTAYVLYGDDARILLAFDPGVDRVFLVLTSIAFALFLIEILLLCWCRDNYLKTPDFASMKELFTRDCWSERISTLSWLGEVGKAASIGSFYFWLDLISTLSMVIEMNWVLQRGAAGNVDPAVGKASMAGAKAARVIRMVRLARLAKLYKYFSLRQGINDTDGRKSQGLPEQSHVGTEMSDRTTKRVIIGIFIMLVGIPLFLVDKAHYLNEYWMKMTFDHRVSLSTDGINGSAAQRWEDSESLLIARANCIDITYNGFNDGLPNDAIIPRNRTRMHGLSVEELEVYTIGDANFSRSMTAIFDASEKKRDEATLGILLTSFVILLLGFGMVSFTRDVNHLVIVPIEHMMQLVKEICENPLGKDISLSVYDKRHNDDGMETTLLIRTISKIAGLMRVGFGEAGADIIGKSLNFADGNDTMNILGNGRKIHSIFGFCDVRQFTDTTECLQEEVMLFVNRIAHILHSIVVQCDGAANKNIGDAFLLTWKVNTDTASTVSWEDPWEDHNYLGDKALYSFVKTMIEMANHEEYLCNFSNRALSELYERMPGYKCRIGCGIHFGWAIEGAIGSLKKIDASYVSPHVNMAEILEASTKAYGTSILMSEPFYNLLSPEAVAGCRKIDVIRRNESDPVTSLYTYDIDLGADFANARSKAKPKAHNQRKSGALAMAHPGPIDSIGESVGRKARRRVSF
jgi:class 3 adenylate cyclase